MTVSKTPERMPPGELEVTDNVEFCMATDEAGPDGRAKGVTFTMRVAYPWVQLDQVRVEWSEDNPNRAFEFTEQEMQDFSTWIEAQYPGLEFTFGDEDLFEASIYGEYEGTEDTMDLYWRVEKGSGYTKLLTAGTVFYHLMFDYIKHCTKARG